jgi:predicted dehydrogenase
MPPKRAIGDAVRANGVQSAAGFNYRNAPAVELARRLIADGCALTAAPAEFWSPANPGSTNSARTASRSTVIEGRFHGTFGGWASRSFALIRTIRTPRS